MWNLKYNLSSVIDVVYGTLLVWETGLTISLLEPGVESEQLNDAACN